MKKRLEKVVHMFFCFGDDQMTDTKFFQLIESSDFIKGVSSKSKHAGVTYEWLITARRRRMMEDYILHNLTRVYFVFALVLLLLKQFCSRIFISPRESCSRVFAL